MHELLVSIEGSALATWTRESPSIWAYPTILTFHTLGLGILVGASAVIDLRLMGFAPRIPIASLRPLFRVMWWAFVLNFVTGVLLFMADAVHKSEQVVFYVKLGFIALALVNTLMVKRRIFEGSEVAEREPGESLVAGRGLAVVSLVLWTGAIIAGRLMAYL